MTDYTSMTDSELNVATAIKVMEYEPYEVKRAPGMVLVDKPPPPNYKGLHISSTFWNPASSIVDAFEVLETLLPKYPGLEAELYIPPTDYPNGKPGVHLASMDWMVKQNADSLPRAICIAALKVVGAHPEES